MTSDFGHVYDHLKDFQQASVDHAIRELFDRNGSRRFLVADEVGLGKTLVARGIIARAIEHHRRKGTSRIDIVYVCSNMDIARQNIRRLNVIPGRDFTNATRLTLLPRVLHQFEKNEINLVSFTPGTSFNPRSAEGIAPERALLFHMLRSHWGDRVRWGRPAERLFAGLAGWERFRNLQIDDPANQTFDKSLYRAFAHSLDARVDEAATQGVATLLERFDELRSAYSGARSRRSPNVRAVVGKRRDFIGELRELLAKACVSALEPDLVILDEFQRFRHLFTTDNPAGELANVLFNHVDSGSGLHTRVVLLSATPYKMYTPTGLEDEDHYRDFLETVRFLLDGDEDTVNRLSADIAAFRRSLFEGTDVALDHAREAKRAIEGTLGRIMSRNERLAVTADRSGMLEARPAPRLGLEADDVRRFVELRRLGDAIDATGSFSYWEATPYPLSLMDDYVFVRRFERAIDRGESLDGLSVDSLTLTWADIARYRQLDPGNTRMRSMMADVIETGMWQLLWLPPSLPYYELDGAYADPALRDCTKRLVFSAWKVVPKAIATCLSYEAERRMMTNGGENPRNSQRVRDSRRGRLNFAVSEGRLSAMPVLTLLYPSRVLRGLGDPLAIAREHGGMDEPVSQSHLLDEVRNRVRGVLEPVVAEHARAGEGVDRSWYWAAPILLDASDDPAGTLAWLDHPQAERWIDNGWDGEEHDYQRMRFGDHLSEAVRLLSGEVALGSPPEDLVDVVAEMAIAAPGNVVYRTFTRGLAPNDLDKPTQHHVAYAAASVAWGFRTLFNSPEAYSLVRDTSGRQPEAAYWRQVLHHCLGGGLQAVVDEWHHVLIDAYELKGRPVDQTVKELAEVMRAGLTFPTVTYGVRRVSTSKGKITVDKDKSMRAHFAVPFGADRAETEETVDRASNVRVAFNSPFRPFVLASTSVGQEGLDFHTYCHAIVHWNLPANPVDLEQREGRVHRYKGHAVRKNVAAVNRAAAIASEGDPWEAMFGQAAEHRAEGDDELVPYWVYAPKGTEARIQRIVPALPLSREAQRFEELKRSTAAYRLVFGQPRQEDMLAYLEGSGIDAAALLGDLQIDLRPRAG